MAIGFRPNINDLGLEDVGVQINEFGAVDVDDRMSIKCARDLGNR